MNCKDFQECACDIVDKRLSEERTNELLQHATVCPHCRYELQALQTAKSAVQAKIHRSAVPADVYFSIVASLSRHSGTLWFQKLFGVKLNPALALVVLAVMVVGIYSLFYPSFVPPDDPDIINQSVANYQAVIGGSIQPQLVSSNDEVKSFLEKQVNFAVNVPKMKNCKSCAGVLSIFNGVKLAHVVYKVNGNVVYIYQANMDDVLKGGKITLSDKVKTALANTNWYVEEERNDKSIVVWRYKNTLCAAVSSLPKDQLIALLTEKETH
ncbi:MAG: hypothetical protein AB1600_01865 [Bacteroidota bacterium]